tara:strand:- start:76916 stop:77314 length:399 start_codon:yes stop_codon:yes gene_type:complete
MSTFIKTFILAVFAISAVFANSMEGKLDLVAAEKAQLAKLAERTDLTVKEWLQFVDQVDAKCTAEQNPEKQTQMCSFYYQIYKIGELFSETQPSGPNWEQCLRAGVTSDSLSTNESVRTHVNRIANKLCPKK